MAKVFISHQKNDAPLAERVAMRIRMNGIDTYLDTVDDALLKDGPDLADHLLRKMSECQQLIAVVAAQMNVNRISTIIDHMSIGETGYAFIADRFERILSHPDKSKVFTRLDSKLQEQVGKEQNLISFNSLQVEMIGSFSRNKKTSI